MEITQYLCDEPMQTKTSHLCPSLIVPINDHVWTSEWKVFCLCHPDEKVGCLRLEVGFGPWRGLSLMTMS